MDIEIYYPFPEYKPNIEQASSRRHWMDASSDSHPYHCIPVVRANSHGWQITLPQDVTVVWNGGEGADAIEILQGRMLEGYDYNLADTSLGHGVLSFHPYILVKTPEPYNLYVTGAPNFIMQGAVPLTGVVETWWSPYTFTMNWKIRYINRPVTFKKGMPYCFFFPINSLELENWTLAEKDIKDHPFSKEHEEWAIDRRDNPQKRHHFYKKGIAPNGCPIANPEFHKLKINLKELDDK